MPHRPRSNRDGSPEFERYVRKQSLAELNMNFLNNPKLSKHQRRFILHAYRQEHPEVARRERQKKRAHRHFKTKKELKQEAFLKRAKAQGFRN